jgi:NAD+ kinase
MNAKNILVLYKKSAFSIYFEHPKSSFKKPKNLPKEIARFEATHRKHFDCLGAVEIVLKRSGIRYAKICRGRPVDYRRFDLIITVGGDGTFLEAARGTTGQAILGVNSDPSWSVGRFCCADVRTFSAIFQQYLDGRIAVKEISRRKLQVRGQEIPVLNDVLVCHHNPAALSRYYLSVGGVREEQKSSGIWISTAAGSSGAIKSAGGRQLPLTSNKIQYRPRELYKGRGKTGYKLRGAVVPSTTKIAVTSLMREGFVFVDGSHIFFPFDFGETITVSRFNQSLRMVWPR